MTRPGPRQRRNPLNAMPRRRRVPPRITNNIVRVGINYKFDPIGAGST
jgi:hypothetical protein